MYERAFPSAGWIAGKIWPYAGALHVQQLWEAPLWTEAKVTVESPQATMAFRTLVFPGWRAFVDGVPTKVQLLPFDQSLQFGFGIASVDVPNGEHTVRIAFTPTPWRTVGSVLSILGCSVILALALSTGAPRARRVTLMILTAGAVTSLAWVTLDVRANVGPTGRATPQRASVIANVAEATLQGHAAISAPDSGAPGAFVDVRYMAIGGHSRRWLYMHPPSAVSTSFVVPPRAVFQTGLGLDQAAWTDAGADGVLFFLEVTDATATSKRLMEQVLQPQVRPEDRGWRFASVDLGRYAGQRIILRLGTEGRDTPTLDWAGWADPVVYVDRSAHYPRPDQVAPALAAKPVA